MSKTGYLFVSTIALMALGCGRSPLLHHANADELRDRAQAVANAPTAAAPDASREPGAAPAPADCPLDFPKTGLCASIAWDQQPTDEEAGVFTARFWSRDGGTSAGGPFVDPAAPLKVAVQLWMPAMGHGSSPVKVVAKMDEQGNRIPGAWSATQVYFSMPGEWEIRLQLKQDKKVVEEAILKKQI